MELSLPQIIIIVSVLVVAFTYLGYNVQKISHFIKPKDFITAAVFITIISCVVTEYLLLDDPFIYWCFPVMAGYIIGHTLAPKEIPLIVNYVQPEQNNNWIDYYVLYKIKDKTYIADQNNRAFIRRLMGIHHELVTDRPIAAKVQISIHIPRKRKTFQGEGIYINDFEETTVLKKIWWRLKVKEVKTTIALADATLTNNIDFVRSAGVLKRQRRQITNLHSQLQKARTEILDKTAERVFEYLFPTDSVLRDGDLQEIPKEAKEPVKEVKKRTVKKEVEVAQ